MTKKFQPRLQYIQSATGKNLTEAAQVERVTVLYHNEEGNRTEKEYWEQEPPPLRSEVALAIRQTASWKGTGPDDVPAELLKTDKSRRTHSTGQNAQNMCGNLGNW